MCVYVKCVARSAVSLARVVHERARSELSWRHLYLGTQAVSGNPRHEYVDDIMRNICVGSGGVFGDARAVGQRETNR